MARLMEERNSLKRKVERLSARGSVDALLEEEVTTLRVRCISSHGLGSYMAKAVYIRKCSDVLCATTT